MNSPDRLSLFCLVAGEGFERSKAKPTDLQNNVCGALTSDYASAGTVKGPNRARRHGLGPPNPLIPEAVGGRLPSMVAAALASTRADCGQPLGARSGLATGRRAGAGGPRAGLRSRRGV